MSERDCLEMEEEWRHYTPRGPLTIATSVHWVERAIDRLFLPICTIAIFLGILTALAGIMVWGILR